jgi:purine-nucleoside phosphorylase
VLETLRTAARAQKITLREGVLMAGKGPAYETAAEIRMARRMGADAACMSSAHEMDLAAALGLATGAVSCITNYGTGLSPNALTHHEVEQVAGAAAGRLETLLAAAIARL